MPNTIVPILISSIPDESISCHLYYRLFESAFDVLKVAFLEDLLGLFALHMRLERCLVLIVLEEMEDGLHAGV